MKSSQVRSKHDVFPSLQELVSYIVHLISYLELNFRQLKKYLYIYYSKLYINSWFCHLNPHVEISISNWSKPWKARKLSGNDHGLTLSISTSIPE